MGVYIYSGGLIFERVFASKIWRAYFRKGFFFFFGGGGGGGGGVGLLSEFYGIPDRTGEFSHNWIGAFCARVNSYNFRKVLTKY